MSKYKQLVSQTLVYGLGTIVPRLLNFLLLTPFYTYIFDFEQDKYGVIVELYSYTAFLLVLLTYGMETTYFRYANKDKNNSVFNNSLSLLLITSSAFILLVLFSKQSISDFLDYSNSSYLIVLFSSIVFFDVITSIPFAYLRNENRAFYFSMIKLGSVIINIFFNVFFLVICRNSDNATLSSFYNNDIGVGYAFISNLLASGFTFLALIPIYFKFRFQLDFKLIAKLLSYSLPLLVVGIAGMTNEVADKLFLRHLIPEDQEPLKVLGIYGANYKMAVLMTIFIQMFKYAAEPFFFKNADQADAKVLYANVLDYFIAFCLFIFLLVTLFIDVFQYFIGPSYRDGLGIVPIVLLANLFLGVYYNLSVWYKVTDKTRYGAYISLIGVLITVSINVIFIPLYGYYASAWATFICYFVMMIISYAIGQKIYKVNYKLGKIFAYFAFSLLLYAFHALISFNYNVFNWLFSATLLIAYLFFVMKLNSLHIKDLVQIKKIFSK